MNEKDETRAGKEPKFLSFPQEKKADPDKLVSADAHVISINISQTKGVVKNPMPFGDFEEEMGLKGDAHSGAWHRMVSLLAIESYAAMNKKGSGDLAIGSFAENLTTSGIVLHELPVGTRLWIGETLHEITQIGKECHTGCAIRQTVGDCVMPREGIFTKIIRGGRIQPGDPITLAKADETH